MVNSILAISGAALLALLFVDVLLTVFHPQGHGGPLHRRQNRFLWAFLRRIGSGRRIALGPRFLALCGPLIAVVSVGSWGLFLIVGFALLYYPLGSSFSSAVGGGVSWIDCLYFSGYTASTLGLGDLIPASPVLRLLTVFEAMSGFALFAVATTYLLALYQQVAKEQIFSLGLSVLFDPGVDVVWEEWRQGKDPGFTIWCQSVARDLLPVLHAHGQYPVLHYFRPVDPSRALLVQIGPVFELMQKADSAQQPVRRLRLTLRRYLFELDHGCLPGGHLGEDRQTEEQLSESLRAAHSRLLRYMEYATSDS